MNLIPKSGMVLIRPIAAQPHAAGLIQLADVYHEPETSGVVVEIADSFVCVDCGARKDTQVLAGDLVIFPASAGNAFELDGVKYLLLAEADVLAVVDRQSVCEVV